MNPIDQDLSDAYKRHGGALNAWKHLGKKVASKAGGAIMSGAKKVNKLTGGENLSKYFGEKIAMKMAKPEVKPFVSQTVSGTDALKSAGKVGLSIAAVASAGGLAKGLAKKASGGAVSTGKEGLKRIISKHKAGGDAKMLNTLKKVGAPEKVRKLPVKTNPLDRTLPSGKTVSEKGQGVYKTYGMNQRDIRLSTVRDELKHKLDLKRMGRRISPSSKETRRGDYKKYLKSVSDGDTLSAKDVAESASKFYKKPQSVIDDYIKRKKLQ